MEISEEGWAKIGAQLALHELLITRLVNASPRRDEIISAVRKIGEGAPEGLLGLPIADVYVDELGKAMQRFLGKTENLDGAL
jgi:hypothetical protein